MFRNNKVRASQSSRSSVMELTWFAELQAQYTNYKNTLQSLAQKAGDIEQEIEEHKWVLFFTLTCYWDILGTLFSSAFCSLCTIFGLWHESFFRLVVETLQPLPDDRKCFRMVNGVLVERTVKDVLPALKTNSDGLKQVLDKLLMEYKSKQDEMESWKVCTDP